MSDRIMTHASPARDAVEPETWAERIDRLRSLPCKTITTDDLAWWLRQDRSVIPEWVRNVAADRLTTPHPSREYRRVVAAAVEVTQADREALKAMLIAVHDRCELSSQPSIKDVLDGRWDHDEMMRILACHRLTTPSPSSEYARGIEDAAKVAEDAAKRHLQNAMAEGAEEFRDRNISKHTACMMVLHDVRALTAQPQEGVVPDGLLTDLSKLEDRITEGVFYEDYDEDLRLLGVFRAHLKTIAAAPKEASHD